MSIFMMTNFDSGPCLLLVSFWRVRGDFAAIPGVAGEGVYHCLLYSPLGAIVHPEFCHRKLFDVQIF